MVFVRTFLPHLKMFVFLRFSATTRLGQKEIAAARAEDNDGWKTKLAELCENERIAPSALELPAVHAQSPWVQALPTREQKNLAYSIYKDADATSHDLIPSIGRKHPGQPNVQSSVVLAIWIDLQMAWNTIGLDWD